MFKIGDRVQLHPATDDWMRGDRYGDVVNVRRNLRTGALLAVTVKLDRGAKGPTCDCSCGGANHGANFA